MYRIAVVEDEQKEAEALKFMLNKYAKEHELEIEIMEYKNAVNFLTNYQANKDLIFMDIEMPYLNGMDAAQKLREIDKNTLLVFETHMGHMAAKGYEVEAFDFVVKPVQYQILEPKLRRIFTKLEQQQKDKVVINSDGARICVNASEIYYVEVSNHQLIYHTDMGDIQSYGTMYKLREQLEPLGFFQCNNCYLVNLRYVKKVENYSAFVGIHELQISHPRKKPFLEALNNYIGG